MYGIMRRVYFSKLEGVLRSVYLPKDEPHHQPLLKLLLIL